MFIQFFTILKFLITIVSPAFQWAQNMNNIFIEVKFAHRHDSPGCLEVNDLKTKIEGNNIFSKLFFILFMQFDNVSLNLIPN